MGKKMQVNSKAAAAKEHQESLNAERQRKKAAQDEAKTAAAWAVGSDQRGSARQAEAERKQMEKLAQKAEKKKLAESEEKELASMKNVPKKTKSKKADIPPWEAALADAKPKKKSARDRMREEAQKKAEEEAAARRARAEAEAARLRAAGIEMVDGAAPLAGNPNRPAAAAGGEAEDEDGFAWASGLDAALDVMSLDDGGAGGAGADRHPEKRMKAAYKAFEAKELPVAREEKPGLKLSQYKHIIFEKWKRSPENPVNRARAAEAAAAVKPQPQR